MALCRSASRTDHHSHHLAELLCKLDHKAEARQQFEQYIRDAQIQGGTSGKHLISAHTRLVELADGDEYAEHLNRGIGLLLLARQLLNRPEKDGTPDPQKLLFQSAAELKEAVERKPDAARPQWYLYETWSELGQQLPARRSLRQRTTEPSSPTCCPANFKPCCWPGAIDSLVWRWSRQAAVGPLGESAPLWAAHGASLRAE